MNGLLRKLSLKVRRALRLDPLSPGFRNLAIGAAALLTAAGVASSLVIAREETILSEAVFNRGSWDAGQASAEWLRIQAALSRVMALHGTDDGVDAAEDLDMRIRIMRGRLNAQVQPFFERMDSPALAERLRSQMLSGLAKADLVLGNPDDRGLAERAIVAVSNLNAAVIRASSQAHAYDIARLAESREKLADLQKLFLGVVLAVVLSGGGLVGMLAYNNRRLRTERRKRQTVEEQVTISLESSGAGWWSREGGWVRLSPPARRILGVGPDTREIPVSLLREMCQVEGGGWLDAEAPQDGGTVNAMVRINHATGGNRWISVMGRTRVSGKASGISAHGILVDVSDREHMARELELSKEAAEKAVAAKSRMLVAASHDLRQPLQSMFLVVDALEATDDPVQRAEFSRLLSQGMRTLKQLLDSVVEVARADTGATVPQIEDFCLTELVSEFEGAYEVRAAEKGLAFRCSGTAATVHSDRTMLGRMIRNLLENAIRYTAKGFVELRCRVEGNMIRIEVQDTGPGIPTDKQDLIFEEFQQLGNSARDRREGLGLGLSIVKHLGALLSHQVELRSAIGEGSTFSILVPLGKAAPSAAREISVAATPGRCVAVVDDDQMVRDSLHAILDFAGYEVVSAASGDEAAAMLEVGGQHPCFLLADYRLGGGEVGTTAVLKMRRAIGYDAPAAILTGEVSAEVHDEVVQHGMQLLAKPIRPADLFGLVERAAESQGVETELSRQD